MRRWNGWGDDTVDHAVPAAAARLIHGTCGPGDTTPDASLASVLARLPAPAVPPSVPLDTDPHARVRATRGQSLPDWIAMRSGRLGKVPDAVAHVVDVEGVREVFALASRHGLSVLPRGGGTSVVGHLTPDPDRPVVVLDVTGMSSLVGFDEVNRLATFGAGVDGPGVERALQPLGHTLGHYPQSWEYSTLGGWIACRSSGQESRHYGRIEQLFAGGHVETPAGPLDIRAVPASAAGPDLRHLVLGSEGRLGVITSASVRVVPIPERTRYTGAIFPEWPSAVEAARAMTQAGLRVSMTRVSDPVETTTSLVLAGGRPLALAPRVLLAPRRSRSRGSAPCLMITGLMGPDRQVRREAGEVRRLVRRHDGLPLGSPLGEGWRRHRFQGPYLRNALWDAGYVVDTAETALPWGVLQEARHTLVAAAADALRARGRPPLAQAHISHVYPDGASLYVTVVWGRRADPDEMLEDWSAMKAAISRATLAAGGTISHQHGVGVDHLPYLAAEKSTLGLDVLRSALASADPAGIMNRSALLPVRAEEVADDDTARHLGTAER